MPTRALNITEYKHTFKMYVTGGLSVTFAQLRIKAGRWGLGLSWLRVFLFEVSGKGKDVGQSGETKVSLKTSVIISSRCSDKHGVSAVK